MAEPNHGGEPAATLDALLDDVDVVWICTWTAAHLEAVEAAVGAGLPVFCEKPLAPDPRDCDAVAARARAGAAPGRAGAAPRARCSGTAAEIVA